MTSSSEAAKSAVLSRIGSGRPFPTAGRAKHRVGDAVVHVRFCSTSKTDPAKYKFNINPNTLTADFELWICGSAGHYYLLPATATLEIYAHPLGYQDSHHSGIRIV